MPYLSALRLSQFRSHTLTKLDVDQRPVAIHGPNGAGKTNILEAISMLSPGRGLRRAGMGEIARAPQKLGWRVQAELIRSDAVHEIATGAEGEASRTVTIDGKAAPQAALGRILRVLWLIPVMDRLWIEGASERRRFLDRMTLSFDPSHGDTVLAYEKVMRERNRLLKDQVRDPGWYEALEGHMAKHGAKITRARLEALERLANAQALARTAFPAAILSVQDSDGLPLTNADDLLTALREGRTRDVAAGRSLIGPHRADLLALYAEKDVEAKFCSTGEQKALLVSLILANARALKQDFGESPLLLLDEVAAHLDANRRNSLYDEIVELGAQAWMTGTGPELFTDLGPRAIHFSLTNSGEIS